MQEDIHSDDSDIHADPWERVQKILNEAGLTHFEPATHQNLRKLVVIGNANRDPHGPVRGLRALLGDSWVELLLLLLQYGPLRFSVLQRLIGVINGRAISRRMLSLGLRGLEREGMVLRRVIVPMPPNVEYSLTPLGKELRIHVAAYMDWARNHSADILAARQAFAEKADKDDKDKDVS